jgi:hypothetical protein
MGPYLQSVKLSDYILTFIILPSLQNFENILAFLTPQTVSMDPHSFVYSVTT